MFTFLSAYFGSPCYLDFFHKKEQDEHPAYMTNPTAVKWVVCPIGRAVITVTLQVIWFVWVNGAQARGPGRGLGRCLEISWLRSTPRDPWDLAHVYKSPDLDASLKTP